MRKTESNKNIKSGLKKWFKGRYAKCKALFWEQIYIIVIGYQIFVLWNKDDKDSCYNSSQMRAHPLIFHACLGSTWMIEI